MRILSNNQKMAPKGETGCTGLPNHMRLYLAGGIPQVFHSAMPQGHETGSPAWLYLPIDQLISMRQALTGLRQNPEGHFVATEPVGVEDHDLYPVLADNTIGALLAVPSGRPCRLDDTQVAGIVRAIASRYRQPDDCGCDVAAQLIARLFSRDNSLCGFMQQLLGLLARQCPGSYAGFYYDQAGVFKLRLATGDISLSDRLPNRLDDETARIFMDFMRRGTNLIPGDLLPDYPSFLDNCPTFLFVHPSVMSDRTEFMLVMALPGYLDREQARRISTAAGLVSQLHESQFSTTSETLDMFRDLSIGPIEGMSLDNVLVDVFKLLTHQCDICRLILAAGAGASRVVSLDANDRVSLTMETDNLIPAAAWIALRQGTPHFVPSLNGGHAPVDTGGNSFDREANSELYYPVALDDVHQGALAVASPLEGEHLSRSAHLVACVADYISVFWALTSRNTTGPISIGIPPERFDHQKLLDRFDTLRKLADGHFHRLLGSLSVAVGQIELLKTQSPLDDSQGHGAPNADAVAKIGRALDETCLQLNNLREILTGDKRGFSEEISCRELLSTLPAMIEGFARKIKDTRNTALSVTIPVGDDSDLKLNAGDVYDYLLPLLLTLMEESLCSGDLKVRLDSENDMTQLMFEFPCNLIAHIGPMDIMQRVFKFDDIKPTGDDTGVILTGRLRVSYAPTSGGGCRVAVSPRVIRKSPPPSTRRHDCWMEE